jgi:hypothetical protein
MAGSALHGFVEGVGVIASGMAQWSSAREIFTGACELVTAPALLPVPESLPAAERRRASRIVKLALGLAAQALNGASVEFATLATVFSASGSDGHNCHSLCETLAGADRAVSPTRFHNSVHNAAAGYWSIASEARGPCQVLCAFDASFAAGLLEALVQLRCGAPQVLLVVCDIEYPSPLYEARPIEDAGGIALLLRAERGQSALARLDARLIDGVARPITPAGLEQLRMSNPALRGLPLLLALAQTLADGQPRACSLEYLAPLALAVDVAPC